jgi:uncharacterized protein (UPF0276 family)
VSAVAPGAASNTERGARRVSRFAVPDLGVGVGFRVPHYRQIVEQRPEMDWFEILSENHMVEGGSPRYFVERLRETYPVVPHGVAMSLGSEENPEHTKKLLRLVNEVDPPWFSDHVCLTRAGGIDTHDLLPVPYTEAVLAHMVDRIKAVQDRFGRPFAVENPSSYMSWRASEMPEADFIAELVERADCALLLDVNNVFVSSVNHGFDPVVWLNTVPADRVVQMHLAGHSILPEGYRLDTHDAPVCEEVWALFALAVRRCGPVSVLIEWDGDIPSWERLAEEAARARALRAEVLEGALVTG